MSKLEWKDTTSTRIGYAHVDNDTYYVIKLRNGFYKGCRIEVGPSGGRYYVNFGQYETIEEAKQVCEQEATLKYSRIAA